jgi:hypothetical protein
MSDDLDSRAEIIAMCLDALRGQGYPDASLETVRAGGPVRAAFIALLEDCRPLPVILDLIADARHGRL